MAEWLLDCQPLCDRPWLLGLATLPHEREEVFRLRHDIFFREQGYGSARADSRDADAFDDWCDLLILYDSSAGRTVGTYRALFGAKALCHGGLYGADEFDFAPLGPILPEVLQGGRTCVAPDYRGGLAFQYLSYGMELLLRRYGACYFLGLESFRAGPDQLNLIHSYLRKFAADPDWFAPPRPRCEVPGLREVSVTEADERRLPGIIRGDLRMGFLACGPPVHDPDFGCYDVPMLGRRDRLSGFYRAFLERIERNLPS